MPAAGRMASVTTTTDMERTRLPQSSTLYAIGYDLANKKLEVEFFNGRVYRYHGVPLRVVMQLMEAESPGSMYNSVIRGVYDSEEI